MAGSAAAKQVLDASAVVPIIKSSPQAAGLQQRLGRAAALVDHIEPDHTLLAEALALDTYLDHPAYDRLYLVLARRELAVLFSADQRLLKLAARDGATTVERTVTWYC